MSYFDVAQSFFVTGMLSILSQTSDARTLSGSVTLSEGTVINLSGVMLHYSTSGSSLQLVLQGYLNLPSDATVESVTFSISYRLQAGTFTAQSHISGLSIALTSGLYLVMLVINVEPQQAVVYL